MNRIKLSEDIQPLSEFRSNIAFHFKNIKKTRRPLVITQNGKSAAIILDVSEYEAMIDKIEVLEDIRLAEKQIRAGKEISHNDVKKKFSGRLSH